MQRQLFGGDGECWGWRYAASNDAILYYIFLDNHHPHYAQRVAATVDGDQGFFRRAPLIAGDNQVSRDKMFE